MLLPKDQNFLYAFNHTESRSRNIFYKHEYRQREIKIIFDTNRLPKKVFLQWPMIHMRFVNISRKSLQITQRVHASISLTGMLVRAQISASQKNRMPLNSNQKKQRDPKFKPQKIKQLKMQTVNNLKKWVVRIDFSVTTSYLHRIFYVGVGDSQYIICFMA